MEIKSNNPKLKQKQLTEELSLFDSVLKRYRNDIKMQCLYRSLPTNHKRSHMPSNDAKIP